jgi:hypothetical protein
VDPNDPIVANVEPDHVVPGAQRPRRDARRERRRQLAVAVERIEETAVDVLGLATGRQQLDQERAQRHAAQATRGDVGRELLGGETPQLLRVVDEEPTGEGLAELGDRKISEADTHRPWPPAADQVAADAAHLPDTAGEQHAERRGGKVDEPASVVDPARRVDRDEATTEERPDVGGHLGVAIVEAVRAGVVAVWPALKGPTQAAQLRGPLEERHRDTAAGRVVRDRESGGTTTNDDEGPVHGDSSPSLGRAAGASADGNAATQRACAKPRQPPPMSGRTLRYDFARGSTFVSSHPSIALAKPAVSSIQPSSSKRRPWSISR